MLNIPLPKRVGSFSTLALVPSIMEHLPFVLPENDPTKLRRKQMLAPPDNNTFVKPIKQCFVKNPRLMPMTRLMLTLISGWAGQGGAIETTTGILAKHLGRCRRQVFRYLQDAMEEGYLFYNRTKDRIGRYTGIRVWLNFPAIRFTRFQKSKTDHKAAETLDVTLKTETNSNTLIYRCEDADLWDTLQRFATSSGLTMPEKPPL